MTFSVPSTASQHTPLEAVVEGSTLAQSTEIGGQIPLSGLKSNIPAKTLEGEVKPWAHFLAGG